MATKSRKLASRVILSPDEGEPITYERGETPSAEHAKMITNPAAWDDGDDDDDEDGNADLRAADVPRREMLKIAADLGLEPGKDFNKSASKDVIAQAIRFKQGMVNTADPGDTPSAADQPLPSEMGEGDTPPAPGDDNDSGEGSSNGAEA